MNSTSQIRLIATDMDGTLLDEQGELSNEFFEIYEKLRKKDIIFTVASGRQYFLLRSSFSNIKDEIIYAAENGSLLIYKNKELYSTFIKRETVQQLIEVGRKMDGCEIVLCGKRCAYIEKSYPDFIKTVERFFANYEIVDNLSDVQDDILKFTLCDFMGAAENSYKSFAPRFSGKLQVTISGEMWLDVGNRNANKGAALRHLQEKFRIKPEETMVFGDNYNDIQMLEAAYHSYAMENAPDEVKKHARFVAKSNRHNGVLEAIKEYVLEADL